MKIIKYLFITIFVVNINCAFATSYGDDGVTRGNALRNLAGLLFDVPLNSVDNSAIGINYTYNDHGGSSSGICNGYNGGHSGIDIQTKDVAGSLTADRDFFSLSSGEVISDGSDTYNTIAIYNSQANKTTIYLHAREVYVSNGESVASGDRLGEQGNAGLGYTNSTSAEHVHVEVRNGRKTGAACGASTTIDPVDYLYSESVVNGASTNQLEIFDFWQSRSDLTYPASCSEGESIINAKFKVKNITSYSIYINKLALAVHRPDGSHFFDMNLWDSEQSIQANGSLDLYESSAWITELGQYELVAKAYYGNKWHKIGTQEFSVVTNNSCSTVGNTENNKTIWITGAYGNNENRSEVLSISGVSSLTVSVSGTTENNYDYLYVYDENGNQVQQLDGSIDTSFTVSGSSITATLITDGSITRSGVTVSIEEGSNTSTGDNNDDAIEEFFNKCINKYSGYFGSTSGSLYICDSDYFCQNTTGGNLGDVTKISIHQELDGNQFRYYWGGWGTLSLDACE